MGPINALTQWAMYFAPAIIFWYRKRNGKKVFGSMGQAFAFNLLAGWTGIVWVIVMANAFGYNPVAWVVLRLVKGVGGVQPGTGPQAGPQSPGSPGSPSSPQASNCSMCGGTGSMTCSQCQGRGSWYDAPQGEHGVAQLRNCGACTSSGRLRCQYCGGSGRVSY